MIRANDNQHSPDPQTRSPNPPSQITLSDIAHQKWDAVIIGAGPAGALAGVLLASQGHKVLLIEKSRWPRDKVCGGCLNASGVEALKSAGLHDIINAGSTINQVTWHHEKTRLQIQTPSGLAISRSEMDKKIVDHFKARGGTFLPQTSAVVKQASAHDNHRTIKLTRGTEVVHVQAACVLACDGLSGTSLSELPWAGWVVEPDSWMGVSTTLDHWPGAVAADSIHMHIGCGGYVGLVGFSGGQVHLAAALNPATCKAVGGPAKLIEQLLESTGQQPPERIDETRFQGAGLLTRHRRVTADHRLLLLGDAAGYIEPFTGEGMGWAIACAVEAAKILPAPGAAWPADLAAKWARVYNTNIRARQAWCGRLRWAIRRPGFLRAGIWLGSALPAVGKRVAKSICKPQAALASGSAKGMA